MRVKRFMGDNLADAMSKTKRELGSEAAILQIREIKEGGFWGLFAKTRTEITAAIEEIHLSAAKEIEPQVEIETQIELAQAHKILAELKSNLVNQNNQLRHPEVDKWLNYLVEKGISRELAENLVHELKEELAVNEWENTNEIKSELKARITNLCSNTQGIKLDKKPLIVAMIGPTGVGKTTTIGKLAASFSIFEKKNIALITADTYRVAAVEQLKIFGEIIGNPVEVVTNPESLSEAITKHEDKEIIFIDTAGRSPHHDIHMSELEEFLARIKPDLTMLVLSVTTNIDDQMIIFERFKKLSTHLVLTKLDECSRKGSILDIVVKTKLPLAYLTNGQSVPDNIEIATPGKLVRYILGEGYSHE